MNTTPHCPSAQPDWNDSEVFAVVQGTADAPRLAYLPAPLAPSAELLQLVEPFSPDEIFRFAAPCAGGRCRHFQAKRCTLVERVVTHLSAVTDELPACAVRSSCRWWSQEGRDACFRCPQVVTRNLNPSPEMLLAALPPVQAPEAARTGDV